MPDLTAMLTIDRSRGHRGGCLTTEGNTMNGKLILLTILTALMLTGYVARAAMGTAQSMIDARQQRLDRRTPGAV